MLTEFDFHVTLRRYLKPAVGLSYLWLGSLMALLLLATGCSSQTLFKSDFAPTAINQPPAHTQAVGTANTRGFVRVVAPPVGPSGKWIQLKRLTGADPFPAFQGNLSQSPHDGTYVFSTYMYIPSGTEVATIQFERFGQSINDDSGFLHLDFMQNNRVRIDDVSSTTFGTFPRNQVFMVQVTLKINASSATAHIVLAGAGTSGTADRNVSPPFLPMARQFGAIRVWMGFPWKGTFDATNILVTRQQ
jgi:hypothetical protein